MWELNRNRAGEMYYCTERYRTKYYGRRVERIQWIVVHYTGTNASALANARALERTLKAPRSTHYFVEDEDVLATVPEEKAAWHVGGKDKPNTPEAERKKIPVYNANSIGVDLCEKKAKYDSAHRSASDQDWYFTEETEATAAELIADIMKRRGIDLDHVVRHYDVTGKLCPRPFVGDDVNAVHKDTGNARWAMFKALIKAHLEGMK